MLGILGILGILGERREPPPVALAYPDRYDML